MYELNAKDERKASRKEQSRTFFFAMTTKLSACRESSMSFMLCLFVLTQLRLEKKSFFFLSGQKESAFLCTEDYELSRVVLLRTTAFKNVAKRQTLST